MAMRRTLHGRRQVDPERRSCPLGSERKPTRPPCASAIDRAMLRPRPVPGTARCRAIELRKNRSKIRFWSSRAIPMPESWTEIRASCRRGRERDPDLVPGPGRELDGVADEVEDNALDLLRVGVHRHGACGHLDDNLELAVTCGGYDGRVLGRRHAVAQVDELLVGDPLALVHGGDPQHVLRQRQQAVGVGETPAPGGRRGARRGGRCRPRAARRSPRCWSGACAARG